MRTTSIRFTGLASGLDTESMVKAMITPYQTKVDSAIQQQKLLELKKDAWRDINNKINKFYSDTLAPLRLEGAFNQKEVTLSQSGVVEIGSNGSFPDGTHTITDVKLAKGAVISTSTINKVGDTKLVGEDGLGIEENTVITVKVNGSKDPFEITVTKEMTLNGFADQLKKAGLNANYDSSAGAFFISSKETGSNQEIKFEIKHPSDKSTQLDKDVMEKLGISPAGEGENKGQYIYRGDKASIVYNGVPVKSEKNVINVNGMNIKLMSESAEGQSITVVSKTDTDAIVDKINNFVDQYNTLIEELNTKVNAAYNKDYLPLTDEQKEAMSEDDIKLWNEKVESSILRKDPVIQSILSSMRDIISSTSVKDVDGKKYDLSSFGISTSSNYKENGKLYIDEEKLSETINKKPDLIQQLFTSRVKAEGQIAEADAIRQSGIGVRLYTDLSERLKGNNLKSSNFLFNDKELDERINVQKDEVTKLEEKMTRAEDLYYAKFASMEKMMSQLNNQSNWLTSQL